MSASGEHKKRTVMAVLFATCNPRSLSYRYITKRAAGQSGPVPSLDNSDLCRPHHHILERIREIGRYQQSLWVCGFLASFVFADSLLGIDDCPCHFQRGFEPTATQCIYLQLRESCVMPCHQFSHKDIFIIHRDVGLSAAT